MEVYYEHNKKQISFPGGHIITLFAMLILYLVFLFLLLCSLGFTGMMLTEPYIETDIQAYLYTYGSWLLLILPSLWLYMKTRAKKKKVQQVVQQIKESSPFAPTSDYEQLSFSKSCYFGIDIKKRHHAVCAYLSKQCDGCDWSGYSQLYPHGC